MTWKDFVCLDWRATGHMSLSYEHTITREAEANGHTFGMCDHTPTEDYKIEHPHARCYTHWRIDGIVYKQKRQFLKALSKI